MREPMFRFEPTGEVRPPERGEYFLNRNGEVLCVKDDCPRVPCEIFRRVPHDPDTAAEVAFARMWMAGEQRESSDEDELEYQRLLLRFEIGDRSPEIVAAMTDLTTRMKGSV